MLTVFTIICLPSPSGYTKAVCLLLLAVEWDYVISLGSDVCHPGLRQWKSHLLLASLKFSFPLWQEAACRDRGVTGLKQTALLNSHERHSGLQRHLHEWRINLLAPSLRSGVVCSCSITCFSWIKDLPRTVVLKKDKSICMAHWLVESVLLRSRLFLTPFAVLHYRKQSKNVSHIYMSK